MRDNRGTRQRARFAAFAVASSLIVAGLVAPQSAFAATAPAAATPEESEAELLAILKSYIAENKGRYSVTVREIDGEQRSLSISGGRQVEPASTIKLFYAYAALRAIDQGTLSLSSKVQSGMTVGGCLTVMIQVSDNKCSTDLRVKLGNKALNALFKAEGYIDTYIVLDSGGNYVTKRTSTDDLALLLTRLEEGTLLSEARTSEFKKRLLAQVWRQRIASGVEAGTVVASKSGQLWVSSGMVEGDTAIIYGPHSTYVLTAIGTNGATGTAIRGISSKVYRHLQGGLAVKATFPRRQFATTGTAKLLSVPGGKVVKTVPKDTLVELVDSTRTWMKVKVDNKYGWVPFHMLRLRNAYLWPSG